MTKTSQHSTFVLQNASTVCKLDFTQINDRWTHVFSSGRSHETISKLRSVEGDASEKWPTSPAFQELTIESRGDQQIALLVGMSGNSHWSCSVTPIDDDDRIGWEFDVACRVKESPQHLGSLYSNESKALEEQQNAITAIRGCRIEDLNIICEQDDQDDQSLPRTICWKYQLATIVR